MSRLMIGSQMVNIRFPSDLVAKLDAVAAAARQDLPGQNVSRSDIIRLACARYVEPVARHRDIKE